MRAARQGSENDERCNYRSQVVSPKKEAPGLPGAVVQLGSCCRLCPCRWSRGWSPCRSRARCAGRLRPVLRSSGLAAGRRRGRRTRGSRRRAAARRRAALMRIPLGARDHAVVVCIDRGESAAPPLARRKAWRCCPSSCRRSAPWARPRLRAGRAAGGAVAHGARSGLRKNHVVTAADTCAAKGRRRLRHRYHQQFLEVHTVSWLKRKSNLFWLGQCAFHRKQRAGVRAP
jgi:hypothetical protein